MILGDSAMEVARTLHVGGVAMFKENMAVLPTVGFLTERGLYTFWPSSGYYPSDAAVKITTIFGRMLSSQYIAFQAEAWYRAYEPDEDIRHVKRGQLQVESERDPNIRTAITTFVYDTANHEQSATIIAVLSEQGLPNVEFAVTEHLGMSEGAAPQGIHRAYVTGVEPPSFIAPMTAKELIDAIAAVTEQAGEKCLWSSVAYMGDDD